MLSPSIASPVPVAIADGCDETTASRAMTKEDFERRDVPRFDRSFFQSTEAITRIGDGELGGKAQGLVLIQELLASRLQPARYPGIEVYVPKMVVLATDLFDAFIARNDLGDIALSDMADDRIAQAFMQAEFPTEAIGDLRALIQGVHSPLAVRSSSLLEDALLRPFAGVYETKMVPNNQPDADSRFLRLVEAIKFVYASTFFKAAKSYIRATDKTASDEKMAVIIQEVVGERHNERFYPDLSGVGRSYNFFPSQGANPADGVVNLALGLGKTIVDGGVSWIYTPTRPKAPPPYGGAREMLRYTQLDFWAVNMGEPPAYDPIAETEYLLKSGLEAADYDDTLRNIASTYDAQRDRLVPGTGATGPRVVNFAPLLAHPDLPVNDLIRELLAIGQQAVGEAVEIEFAMTLPKKGLAGARFGFLQMRPMLVSEEEIELSEQEMAAPGLLLASDRVMGNGEIRGIRDVVYVKPDTFEAKHTPAVAAELENLNRRLFKEGRHYMLIGFGRWGSSDPWLGIPVNWGQIAGAKVIVESTLAGMDVEPSQGAHFFQNIISFRVCYLCVRHTGDAGGWRRSVDWEWLGGQAAVAETEHVRHVRLESELRIKVDGRSGRGAVWVPVQV
jgi:hypothetical protein